MSIEVEIKAWIDDPELIKSRLNKDYLYVKEYIKEDVYLKGIDSLTNKVKEIRVRRSDNCNIVTYKERKHEEKVEVNIEKEFIVDDYNNFIYVLNQLGFMEYITKHKKGTLYKHGDVNLELSYVKDLGNFIEIEYLVENKKLIDEAKSEIFKILDNLKIPREKIEDRYYTQMLRELKRE